jgi:hypothetical protein
MALPTYHAKLPLLRMDIYPFSKPLAKDPYFTGRIFSEKRGKKKYLFP